MKIYYEKLSDVQRYLDNNKDIGLDEKEVPLQQHNAHRTAL